MSQQDVKWKELSVSDSQASSDNSDVVRGDCCVRIARKRNDAFETERIEIRWALFRPIYHRPTAEIGNGALRVHECLSREVSVGLSLLLACLPFDGRATDLRA